MRNQLRLISLLVFSSMVCSLMAQVDQKKSVVLINGIANEVWLSSAGDVLESLRILPNYLPFSGGSFTLKEVLGKNPKYKIHDDQYNPVQEVVAEELPVAEVQEVAEITEPKLVVKKKTAKPIDDRPTLISVASSSDDLGVRVVYFDAKNAALDDEATFKLNEVANVLNRGSKIILQIVYLQPGDSVRDQLVEKRANAIKRYLELKGIDQRQISLTGTSGSFQNSVDLYLNKS